MKAVIAILIVIIATAAVFFVFKPVQEGEKQGTIFHYYPKANIYYDVDNKQYFLLSDKGWEPSNDLPDEQKSVLGEKVILDHPDLPVYKSNAHHRIVYAATLYTSQTDLQNKFYEDSVKSLPKKEVDVIKKDSIVAATENERKSKTGIGRFFNKIFSGDKKKKREAEKKKEEQN